MCWFPSGGSGGRLPHRPQWKFRESLIEILCCPQKTWSGRSAALEWMLSTVTASLSDAPSQRGSIKNRPIGISFQSHSPRHGSVLTLSACSWRCLRKVSSWSPVRAALRTGAGNSPVADGLPLAKVADSLELVGGRRSVLAWLTSVMLLAGGSGSANAEEGACRRRSPQHPAVHARRVVRTRGTQPSFC